MSDRIHLRQNVTLAAGEALSFTVTVFDGPGLVIDDGAGTRHRLAPGDSATITVTAPKAEVKA